jgi:hypothetical protein
LARTSVGTGTSLEDLVSATGEMQRQLNIDPRALGASVRREIARGRLGSIQFQDEAAHLGVLAGGVSRFMGTGNAEQSQQALDVTSALFQTAGQGGGGGDQSATRARAFINNMTSGRGRHRLEGLLGHAAFDTSGQLLARQGENQAQAFQRMIEETWTASHGNADRFLTAIAGVKAPSRVVGDQLMRDLRQNRGHLSHFAQLLNPGEANADASFNDVANTDAIKRARQENRTFFRQTDREAATPYTSTDRMMRDLKERSPFLGSVLDNSVMRGALDLSNRANPGDAALLDYSDDVRSRAGRESLKNGGWLSMLYEGDEATSMRQQASMEQLTSGAVRTVNKETTAGKPGAGPTAAATATIPQDSMERLGQVIGRAVADAIAQTNRDPHGRALAAAVAASGTNSPPPEARR